MSDLFALLIIAITINGLDDLFIDLTYWFAGKTRQKPLESGQPTATRPPGRFAIFVPAWQEAAVIGAMLQSLAARLTNGNYVVYLGIYPNDRLTKAAALAPFGKNPDWLKCITLPHNGPTTKADCLNHLWLAAKACTPLPDHIVLHDAEDLVIVDELALYTPYLGPKTGMVQLPVLPLVQTDAPWVGGHYLDEFAEMHGKELPLRHRLTGMTPCAGVGCCFPFSALDSLDTGVGPFDPSQMTEDYTLSHRLADAGFETVFVPLPRHQNPEEPELAAVREFFPKSFTAACRQKARWIIGICLQSPLQLGWSRQPRRLYGQWRDRKGPVVTIIYWVTVGWLVVVIISGKVGSHSTGGLTPMIIAVPTLLMVNRLFHRCYYTSKYYGWSQGFRAAPRAFVSNMINVAALGLALWRFARALRHGSVPVWDKTDHEIPTTEP